MMLNALLLDNPILVRYLRSRLRRQHVLPLMAVVVIIAACIAWGGLSHAEYESPSAIREAQMTAFMLLMVLQGLLLLLGGIAQVAGSVMHARENSMIDFHRVSPQRPVAMALGFLLGAPVREYILFACTVPFMLLVVIQGEFGVSGLLLVWLDMLALAVLYQSIGLLCGLAMPKARSVGVLVVLLVVVLHLLSMVVPFGYFTIIPTVTSHMALDIDHSAVPGGRFFAAEIPAVLLSLLHQVPLALFIFFAAVRKMRHERAVPFARPIAVIFLAVLAVLIFGDTAGPAGRFTAYSGPESLYVADRTIISIVYWLLFLGLLLTAVVTPGLNEFVKGVRHAKRLGLSRVPAWGDTAMNLAPLLAFTAILALAGGLASLLAVTWKPYLLATAIGAMALLVFGLAKQCFHVYFRKHGMIYFTLSLFLVWIVPLLLAFVVGISGGGEEDINTMLGISPLSAISGAILADEEGRLIGSIALSVGAVLTIISALWYAGAWRKAVHLANAPEEIAVATPSETTVPPAPIA